MLRPQPWLPDILSVGEDRQQIAGQKKALRLSGHGRKSACDIFSIYLSGGPRYRLNSETYQFRAPVAILIPAGTIDCDWQVGAIRGIFVLFKSHGLIKPGAGRRNTVIISWGAQSLEAPIIKPISTAQAVVLDALLRDLQKVRGTDLVNQLRRATLLFRAIAEYCACATPGGGGSIHREAVRLKELLESQAFHNYALEELYAKLNVSATHAALLFKKAFEVSPVAYRKQLRLQEARKLLVSSPLAVKAVAQAVGFADPLYFTRVFHQAFGVAPSELIRDFARRREMK